MIPEPLRIREPGIYRIVNKVTWQSYYGRANDLSDRYWFDRDGYLVLDTHHNPYLVRAFLKYGREAFAFEIVQISDLENLQALEQHYLDYIVRWGFDYNMSPRADRSTGMLGRSQSPETREKIGSVHRGRPKTAEEIRKQNESRLRMRQEPGYVHHLAGKKKSEEELRRRTESRRRKKEERQCNSEE